MPVGTKQTVTIWIDRIRYQQLRRLAAQKRERVSVFCARAVEEAIAAVAREQSDAPLPPSIREEVDEQTAERAERAGRTVALHLARRHFDAARAAIDRLEDEHRESLRPRHPLSMYLTEAFDDLEITNTLEAAGIETVEQLRRWPPERLAALPNFGPRRVELIKDRLRALGIPYPPKPSDPPTHAERIEA